MIPRFANPHTYSQSTSYVSRGELYTDSNVNEDANVAEEGVLSVLEQLVKRSLGEYISDHVDIPKEPTERKKKRRRVEENGMEVEPNGLQTTDLFRLVSSSAPPRVISLLPKPRPVLKVREPPTEDNDEEARIRSERAAAIAVDASWIFEQSRKPYHPPRNSERNHLIVQCKSPQPEAELFVLEAPRSPSSSLKTPRLPEKTRPSPHDFPEDKIPCPVIQFTPSPQPDRPTQTRRVEKKRSLEPRPFPTFWRPRREWGGKGMGYALGYPGSKALNYNGSQVQTYRRDKMRKGVFIL